jgi:hypothetical protein
LASAQASQNITSDVTQASQNVTNVTDGAKESFPHTPFKEKTNPNLTVSITPLNPPASFFENYDQTPQEQSLPDGFEEFWKAYPERAGGADRKNAAKAYRAAIKRALPSDILSGAKSYRRHLVANGKIKTEFVRQARTWLNADSWTENYHAAATTTQTGRPKPTGILETLANEIRELDDLERRSGAGDAAFGNTFDTDAGDPFAPNSRL